MKLPPIWKYEFMKLYDQVYMFNNKQMATLGSGSSWNHSDPTGAVHSWRPCACVPTRCSSKWLKVAATCASLFPNPKSVKADVLLPSPRYPVFSLPCLILHLDLSYSMFIMCFYSYVKFANLYNSLYITHHMHTHPYTHT